MIDLMRHRAVASFEITVLIPRVGPVAGADAFVETTQLDEAYATLHKAPGE